MTYPKLIPVGKNNFALVDEDDYELVVKHKWIMGCHRYAMTKIGDQIIFMHYMIMKAKGIDHINSFGLDNRKCNLRIASVAENMRNSIKCVARADRICSSKYKGVSFRGDRQRWQAYIGTGKSRDILGCYSSEEAAARAYNEAAKVRYGQFAKLNILPEDYDL